MNKKCGSGQFSASRVRIGIILLAAISIAFIAMSSTALGQVSYYTVSPTDLVQGEDVTISGKADPKEEVTVFITFEDVTEVTADKTYRYPIYDIGIPEGTEHFDLVAEGVNDLDIDVKITSLYIPVPDRYISIENGIATFGTSQIDSGTYSIIMSGRAPGDEVNILIKTRATITADKNGYFEQTYNTENLPAGTYTITINRASQQMIIREASEGDGSSDGDDSSDGDGSSDGDDSSDGDGSSDGDDSSDGDGSSDGDDSSDDGSSDDGNSSNTTKNVAQGGSNTGTEFKIRPADSSESGEGAGDDSGSSGSLASTQESEGRDSDSVEGSMLEKQTPAESSYSDVKIIGVVAVAIGLIGLGTIMYKKKSK